MGYLLDRDRNERVLRRLLHLPGQLPDPTGFEFVPADNGYLTMEQVADDEQARRWAQWHAAPRRAHVAHETARKLYSVEYRLRRRVEGLRYEDWSQPLSALCHTVPGGRRVQGARAKRRLRQARHLTVSSHYVHRAGGHEFEGYIDLGDGLSHYIEIATADIVADTLRDPLDTNKRVHGSRFAHTLFVDVPSIDAEVIADIVADWYVERYRWTPGHWTQPDDLRPTVTVDVEFEEDAPEGAVRAIAG